MGIPECLIEFRRKALDMRWRSARGVVALVLKDTTGTVKGKTVTYKSFDEVKESDWTEDNYDFLRLTFLGEPSKVIVEVIDDFAAGDKTLDKGLEKLEYFKFNYLAVPEIPSDSVAKVEAWITKMRKKGRTYKAVLTGVKSKTEKGLINFTTKGIKVKDKAYSTEAYTARVAGILAGLPSTQSITYHVLEEVTEITVHDDENAAVDNGELILTNDGEKIKFVRGVTAMTEVGLGEIEDFKKIKILDTADLIKADIQDTWENYYVGKVMNTYPNKVLFFGAIKGYLDSLRKQELLDPNVINEADVAFEAQKKWIKGTGVDVTTMTEQELKEFNTGSYVFGYAKFRIADAMEDLKLELYM